MTAPVRVAVVQDAPVAFDRERTMARVETRTREAAAAGASLVLFPEAFVSAYPKGLTFGAVVGSRTPEGRREFQRYWDSSVDVPGPVVHQAAALCAETGVHLVLPVIERDRGTLYCTALFFSPSAYLGKHRKVMPTALERLVWGFGDGSTLPVYDTDLGRLGAVICWENYMPMLRMAMYGKGVQLYCAPTADDRETWLSTVRHIALEGRCFVLSCCQYATRGDYPDDYATPYGDDPATVLMRGGSCIAGPLGDVLAGPAFDGPTILTADLDLDEVVRGKYDLDVTGHYARPDIFELRVNERATRPVTEA